MRASRRSSGRSGCGRTVGILCAFALVLLIAGSVFFWRALTTPYKGWKEASTRVEIRRGSNSRAIMKMLQREGVLRDDFVPLVYLKTLQRGASLKAGVYEFSNASSPLGVLDKLIRADVILKSITIREGLDRFAVGEMMVAEGFGKKEEWKKKTADPEIIRDIDPAATSVEGYLFPDTYKITPGTSVDGIIKLMTANFRKHFGSELAFITNGLDLHDTVTLASIVETEAQLEKERPVVASVYLNRHRLKMPLQADPTVIYAMKLRGIWNGNITREDLRSDSEYNTYRRRGFPPGPIANPGLASLRAAASPASTDYLYFVSRNDGSHVFARSLAEHNRNVNEFQRNGAARRAAQAAARRNGPQ